MRTEQSVQNGKSASSHSTTTLTKKTHTHTHIPFALQLQCCTAAVLFVVVFSVNRKQQENSCMARVKHSRQLTSKLSRLTAERGSLIMASSLFKRFSILLSAPKDIIRSDLIISYPHIRPDQTRSDQSVGSARTLPSGQQHAERLCGLSGSSALSPPPGQKCGLIQPEMLLQLSLKSGAGPQLSPPRHARVPRGERERERATNCREVLVIYLRKKKYLQRGVEKGVFFSILSLPSFFLSSPLCVFPGVYSLCAVRARLCASSFRVSPSNTPPPARARLPCRHRNGRVGKPSHGV